MSIIGYDENLPVKEVHDIYPAIDPQEHYSALTFKGKVVLITGASRGIGLESALQYARAGASLALASRKQTTLDESKTLILKEAPTAQVITFVADVKDLKHAEAAVKGTVAHFGKLDILISNAGKIRAMGKPFVEMDPIGWWETQEVNLRGAYNFVHYAIPELIKTKGRIILVSSLTAQLRMPSGSDYGISKFALGRLAEFIAVEYPDVKVFTVDPGTVQTELNTTSESGYPPADHASLSAAVFLYLSAGKADYLSSRFVSANWDLAEVEKDWKDKIVAQNSLVNKLSIPT
ncbi:NAD-P-binding protein [Auriscalpium vulgare]|uniref:NAD-P-binding protein n=1 Tax=Auriscalpium vulgare TaxID=40419 RepID=A0ACB8RJC6_9AGAM|nr:NAD-P-binding protein [Auriscalpium vulgare]